MVGLISIKYTSKTDTLLIKNGFKLSTSTSALLALTTGITVADPDSSTIKPHTEIGLEQFITTVRDYIEALKSYLNDILPSYIIPTIWVVFKDILLDPSGKTSCRQLDDWLSRMD